MTTNEALIHLRVPAAMKGRWVRASRAAGMRLTDWIVAAVEAQMQQQIANVIIPDNLAFSDLRLARARDGSVSLDWDVIERICEASELPPTMFRDAPEDNVAGLIMQWYRAHLHKGGSRDPIADDLIAEAQAEDSAGQPYSFPPGRA